MKMTKTEAKKWVRTHNDSDDLCDDELDAAFAAIFRRAPDDEDREQGLWSHLCAAVEPERQLLAKALAQARTAIQAATKGEA